MKQPVARMKCVRQECSATFPKKVKDTEKMMSKGKTNITHQRHKMEYRADILKMHHNCDTIILTHRKHGLGYTVSVYGTEGLAEMFIGSSTSTRSKEGHAIVNLFERFMSVKKTQKMNENKESPAEEILYSQPCVDMQIPETSDSTQETIILNQQTSASQEQASTNQQKSPYKLPAPSQKPLQQAQHMPIQQQISHPQTGLPTLLPNDSPNLLPASASFQVSTPAVKLRTLKLTVPNVNYQPNTGDTVIVIGKHGGKPQLFGSGTVIPGKQLHFKDIGENASKITFLTISFKDKNAKSFYCDKYGDDGLAIGQFYEWPNTYLFPIL